MVNTFFKAIAILFLAGLIALAALAVILVGSIIYNL